MLADPLSWSLHGLGQRMQFPQLKGREFISLLGGDNEPNCCGAPISPLAIFMF
jgi:hypothetical protein